MKNLYRKFMKHQICADTKNEPARNQSAPLGRTPPTTEAYEAALARVSQSTTRLLQELWGVADQIDEVESSNASQFFYGPLEVLADTLAGRRVGIWFDVALIEEYLSHVQAQRRGGTCNKNGSLSSASPGETCGPGRRWPCDQLSVGSSDALRSAREISEAIEDLPALIEEAKNPERRTRALKDLERVSEIIGIKFKRLEFSVEIALSAIHETLARDTTTLPREQGRFETG